MSLSELGRRTGIAYQTIAKYEKGENEPTWPTVLKLAAALGVEVGEFVSADQGDDAETPPATKRKNRK